MIKEILELLDVVDDGTENIRIAKGKYKLPLSVKEAVKLKTRSNKWKE